MAISTVNISFNSSLLSRIDKVAKKESRTRSELIREASRMYIERKKKWDSLFNYGAKIAAKGNISEKDIAKEIKAVRNK